MKCLHDDISGPCVSLLILVPKLRGSVPLKNCEKLLSEEFELTANSLEAHMKVTESSPSMGHSELI